jgi:hypothetical protein
MEEPAIPVLRRSGRVRKSASMMGFTVCTMKSRYRSPRPPLACFSSGQGEYSSSRASPRLSSPTTIASSPSSLAASSVWSTSHSAPNEVARSKRFCPSCM